MSRRSVVLVVLMVLAWAGPAQAQEAERWYVVSTYSRDSIVTTYTWYRPNQLDETIAMLQRLRNGTAAHEFYDFTELDHEGYVYGTRFTCLGNVCEYAPNMSEPAPALRAQYE
jgi:hypothetical protein